METRMMKSKPSIQICVEHWIEILTMYIIVSIHVRFRGRNKIKGGGICNPVNTLYSRIMYNYAQFNKMRIFPRFWNCIKLILCTFLIVKHDFWLNGISFPHSDRAGAFRMQKLGK